MNGRMTLCWWTLLFAATFAHAATSAKILQVSGEVKVRRGMEEKWENAAAGMLLEEVDTIMALENGEAVLELAHRATFRLGGNSIIDIADLREITARELFLLLMSQKVGKLAPRSEKAPLRIGEVSAVRGAPFQSFADSLVAVSSRVWRMEANAAYALRAQNFMPNAALKLHRVKEKFPQRDDCGEVNFALGQILEILQQPGQARDAYQFCLAEGKAQNCASAAAQARQAEAAAAVQRLR